MTVTKIKPRLNDTNDDVILFTYDILGVAWVRSRTIHTIPT